MSAANQLVQNPTEKESQSSADWSLGWRYETVTVDGHEEQVRLPLTPEEARHPKEGYVMPERTEHDSICSDLCDMLRAKFADENDVAVFRNLVFIWSHPEVGDYAPDVAVVRNVRNREANRTHFAVAEEGTYPSLVIEVVSRNSRKDDRVNKVKDYALVGVQEYVYIDKLTRRRETVWELVGYRFNNGATTPMLPDEDGALYLESVNMRIGIENGHVWLEDGETGQDILTSLQVRQALRQEEAARQTAEMRAQAEEAARQAAETTIAELQAQLQALRAQTSDQA